MNLKEEGLILIKVKRFDHYQFTDDDINKFLEENYIEYVDLKCTKDSIFLIYRDRKNGNYRKPYEKYPEDNKED